MDIVYGPVSSWRLGRSLGVDLICGGDEKICSFDCTYCTLGETDEKTVERRTFVRTDKVEEAVEGVLDEIEADVITFSGTGEPTLAENIGEAMDRVGELTDSPLAVLSNSSLMWMEEVRSDLAGADIVVGSLDAPNEELFEKVNKPHESLSFEKVVEGMKEFSRGFDGSFSLEIMFVPETMDFSEDIAEIVKEIGPDEVQLNTPLRSSPVESLTPDEIEGIKEDFEGLNCLSVHDAEEEGVEKVVGPEKLELLKRSKKGGE